MRMKQFIRALVGVLFVYGFFSFMTFDFNPSNWGDGGRFTFAFLAVLVAGVAAAWGDFQ
jgi:hypothetical protein